MILKQGVDDFALNEKFKVKKCVNFIASLIACLHNRIHVFIWAQVISFIWIVINIAQRIHIDLNFDWCFLEFEHVF